MKNSLEIMFPEVAKQWSTRNFPLLPKDVSYGSNKKVWWRGECGHEWQASPHSRTGKNSPGCPYCSGNRVLAGFNDFASRFPEIAAEWSEKNYPLRPDEVTAFSNKKAWWKGKCGHEWYTISINHTMNYTATLDGTCKYTVTVPKSNTGKREIPMLTEVRDTLLALYERRNDFNADNQIVVDGYTNFVFRDLYGRVYSNHRINRQLKRITAKYNQEEHAEAEQEGREENPLPPITCHMLRHTFCTRMILGGIDLKTVQIIMGHADAETTMRVYANVTKAQAQNEMMRMEGKMKLK